MKPVFISIEGIDGAGKSTHLEAIETRLRACGAQVARTREPGGTPLAEQLRELLLNAPMDPVSEALLMFTARRDNVLRVIRPALQRGEVVLADRFADSSFAYQGGGRGVPLAVLEQLEAWACEGLTPDLTLWFDIDPAVAAQRRAQARAADRFESEDLAFFERARAAYLARLQAQPMRVVRIAAEQGLEQVRAAVLQALQERGW